MLCFVEVPSNHVDELRGTAKGSGRPYCIRRQEAYIHNGGAYPEKFKLPLGETQTAYEPGRYLIAQGSFERDRTNADNFVMARHWNLVPLDVAVSKLSELVGPSRGKVAA